MTNTGADDVAGLVERKQRERSIIARFRSVVQRIKLTDKPQPAALTAKTISDLLDLLDFVISEREAAEVALAEAREALMEADMARKRLQDYANAAQRGEVQAGGRELSRKVWGAFAEYDAIRARTIANPDADREGVKL